MRKNVSRPAGPFASASMTSNTTILILIILVTGILRHLIRLNC